MRIRRNAAKLLGTTTSIYSATTWPHQPPSTAAIAGDAVCELNCSPWDVLDFDFDHYCFSLTNPKKEEGGDRGIIGNIVKTESISTITSEVKEKKPRKKKTTTTTTPTKTLKNKKKDEKESSIEEEKDKVAVVTYCKKNDGKGWHCKRAAQLPHTFCSYHIEQLRSYNSMPVVNNNSDVKKTAKSSRNVAASERGVDSKFYYYCNGFGPMRAKKRGGVKKKKEEDVVEEAQKKVVEEDCNGNGKDSSRNNVAGGDEYGLDEDDDDDDDEKCNGESKRSGMNKKKKKARTRSLKSLL